MKKSCENVTEIVDNEEVDQAKREFMKKFGKYAAVAPVGMYMLMGPGASKAQASATVGCAPIQYYFNDQQNIQVITPNGTVTYTPDDNPEWSLYYNSLFKP